MAATLSMKGCSFDEGSQEEVGAKLENRRTKLWSSAESHTLKPCLKHPMTCFVILLMHVNPKVDSTGLEILPRRQTLAKRMRHGKGRSA